VTYRISPALFIEEGPVADLANARAARSTALIWKLLDEASRLDLVERRLRPANDRIDAYPLAL
jgi:hypothetical protein